jgi:hypothetical protein
MRAHLTDTSRGLESLQRDPSCPPAVLLLISADALLYASLAEYLVSRGYRVCDHAEGDIIVSAAVVDADAWPAQWTRGRLRRRFPHTPCILLSGSPLAGPDTVSRLRHGFFLPKPVRPAELASMIDHAVNG